MFIKNTFNIDRSRKWWEQIGKGAFSPAFAAFVDEQIKDGDRPDEWYIRLPAWESTDS